VSQSEIIKANVAEERSEQTRSFVRTVKAATRRKYNPEEKIRIVLEGFRREVSSSYTDYALKSRYPSKPGRNIKEKGIIDSCGA